MPSFQIPCRSRKPRKRPYAQGNTSPCGVNENEGCLCYLAKGFRDPLPPKNEKASPMQNMKAKALDKKKTPSLLIKKNETPLSFLFSAKAQKQKL